MGAVAGQLTPPGTPGMNLYRSNDSSRPITAPTAAMTSPTRRPSPVGRPPSSLCGLDRVRVPTERRAVGVAPLGVDAHRWLATDLVTADRAYQVLDCPVGL
jgi:hypothetical protein